MRRKQVPRTNRQLEQRDKLRKELKAQRVAFSECFRTVAGASTLAMHKAEFYDNEIQPGPSMEYQVGQRSVLHAILEQVENNE